MSGEVAGVRLAVFPGLPGDQVVLVRRQAVDLGGIEITGTPGGGLVRLHVKARAVWYPGRADEGDDERG